VMFLVRHPGDPRDGSVLQIRSPTQPPKHDNPDLVGALLHHPCGQKVSYSALSACVLSLTHSSALAEKLAWNVEGFW